MSYLSPDENPMFKEIIEIYFLQIYGYRKNMGLYDSHHYLLIPQYCMFRGNDNKTVIYTIFETLAKHSTLRRPLHFTTRLHNVCTAEKRKFNFGKSAGGKS